MTADEAAVPYEKPVVGPDLVDILRGMQPLIAEVTNLRRECTRLRMREAMPPGIQDLFERTPVSLFRDDRGFWGYTITLKAKNTGGRGYPSLVEAARSALGRFLDLGFDFTETNEDDEAEWAFADNVFVRVEGFAMRRMSPTFSSGPSRAGATRATPRSPMSWPMPSGCSCACGRWR